MIGLALIRECRSHGMEVTAVARRGSRRNRLIPIMDGVEVVECSLEELSELPSRVSGRYDVFFHLGWGYTDKAGRLDPWLQEKNVGYTLEAVRSAKAVGCQGFVGAGSQAEYGQLSGRVSENAVANPTIPYAIAKDAARRLSLLACERVGLRHVWTRIFSVYGPHNRDDNMLTYCMEKLLRGERPALTRCEQAWDFLYCDDAARALYLVWDRGQDRTVYNVASGSSRPLSEYVTSLRDAIDSTLQLGFGEVEYPAGRATDLCGDIAQLVRDTGFAPTTPFETGIRETLRSFRERLTEQT